MQKSLPDNFDFQLFGAGQKAYFRGYISSTDPTIVGPGVLIGGSHNVYKRISQDIFVRPGLKRRGTPDATLAGVTSSFEWETSVGVLRPLRVIEDTGTGLSKLQVESDIADGDTLVWYDLLTGQTSGRFVFDTWWDASAQKDVLLFVNGNSNIGNWSGGMGLIAGTTSNTITLDGSAISEAFDTGGGSIIINGTTYTYSGSETPNVIYTHTDTDETITLDGTPLYVSQLFTAGVASVSITNVVVRMNFTSTYAFPFTVTCSIYSNNAGVPGTLLSSAVFNQSSIAASGAVNIPFTFNQPTTPSASYHLVLTTSLSSQAIAQFYTGPTGSVGTNTSDDGVSWSAHDGYLYATVTENIGNPNTLTGVSPDPSGEALGSVVVQVPGTTSNQPALNFDNDFIKVIANQLYVGSYVSQFVYNSSNTNYADFNVPAVRAPGDPDVLTLGSLARGITVQKGATDKSGNAVIAGGLGDWYTILRSQITVGTTLTEQVDVIQTETADLSTALAHEFIDLIGDTIVFLDQNNQLRQFGLIRNIVSPVLPLLSLDVFTELKGRDFTGGALRVVEDEGDTTVYITCPTQGIDYMYQVREEIDAIGNIHTERLWQPPQIRGISRIAVIDGVTYGYSATNPQSYQLWNTDQYYDDGPFVDDQLPYSCHAIFSYLSLSRTRQMNFDKLYFEGYMGRASEVYCSTYQEYQGSKNILTTTINKPTAPGKKSARFYGAVFCPVPGESILGDIEIGDGILPPDIQSSPVPKFRAMRRIAVANIFEAALDIWSESLDAQWGLLAVGANMQPADSEPTEIMGIN